jgi:hypothetical protein
VTAVIVALALATAFPGHPRVTERAVLHRKAQPEAGSEDVREALDVHDCGALTVGASAAAGWPAARVAPVLRCDAAQVLASPAAREASSRITTGGPLAAAGMPACFGEICQPRVSVPGFEPSISRAKRGELVLRILARSPVAPIASIAETIASSNLWLEFTPGPLQTGPQRTGSGWGRVVVSLRWHLDAANAPVE